MKSLKIFLIIILFVLLSPIVVFADDKYIEYSDIMTNGKVSSGTSSAYNNENGEYINYDMDEILNSKYSFIITGTNLNDDETYTYTLISDFKNLKKTFTGEELKQGVVISGEDGNSVMESTLVDKNNQVIRNKSKGMDGPVYFNTTYFKFNDNFDATEFDKLFNSISINGVIKVNSIDPLNDTMFAETALTTSLKPFETKDLNIYAGCYNKGELCDLTIQKNGSYKRKNYKVKFEYVKANEAIKNKLDKYAKTFVINENSPEKELFTMEDLETINYKYAKTVYGDNMNMFNSIINYSSEFQKKLENSNIVAKLDARAGWDDMFTSGGFGFLNLLYNDVVYSYVTVAGVKQNNVIYVPNDTNDTRDDYIKVALDRIKKYIPKANVKIEYAGQISTLTFDDILSLDDIVDVSKTLGEYYKVTINDTEYYYFIAKDSSRMKTPIMNTKDAETEISISTNSSEVPLDTKINSYIVDSNSSEYKEFLKHVKISNGLVVDLKLFSKSINKNISKLDNDVFKVYIPLNDSLKNLNLKAYYIKDNGEIEQHDVIVEGNYLVFETNHFSTYIIGGNAIKNPATSDSFVKLSIAFLISLFGLITTFIYVKKVDKQ